MKKLAIILTMVAATAMIFSSCGKYEEGPSVSLLTKKARITGTWKVIETSTNGTSVDLGDMVTKTTIEKDGTGSISVSGSFMGIDFSSTSDLEWEFNDSKEGIKIRTKGTDETEWSEWDESEIIRLTNKECWTQVVETTAGVTTTTITKMEKE
jgi:hypothetical protein